MLEAAAWIVFALLSSTAGYRLFRRHLLEPDVQGR